MLPWLVLLTSMQPHYRKQLYGFPPYHVSLGKGIVRQIVLVPCEGVYPQSDDFKSIAQWEHLSFAIFAISDLKRHLKLLEMACDQVLTYLIFPLWWVSFPIKVSRNAHQWEHLFLIYFDDFSTIYLNFKPNRPLSMKKLSLNGNTIYFR